MIEIKDPINMKAIRKEETQAEHYQDIADMIDTYADTDKKFMLWYLLGNMREGLQKNIDNLESKPVKDVSDYAVRRMIYDHYRWSEDMRNVLQEEIF
jgi:hypothetical protein